ncbi:helix-turn-helix domain-containing protein [Cohnella panacarvi]|uniref:helix-turn-helix domain-containing protein n=1 Tax=Cohnella panacarvi TaxID=400776 RepID=UPI000A010B11|nr:helix-turn-helix transcriptional regulator [Cohnella panacarvi]
MCINENEIKTDFGNAIRKVRTQKDYSQERLAEISGLHRTYISEVERGDRNISLVNIIKLCKALDISLSQLSKIIEEE